MEDVEFVETEIQYRLFYFGGREDLGSEYHNRSAEGRF